MVKEDLKLFVGASFNIFKHNCFHFTFNCGFLHILDQIKVSMVYRCKSEIDIFEWRAGHLKLHILKPAPCGLRLKPAPRIKTKTSSKD